MEQQKIHEKLKEDLNWFEAIQVSKPQALYGSGSARTIAIGFALVGNKEASLRFFAKDAEYQGKPAIWRLEGKGEESWEDVTFTTINCTAKAMESALVVGNFTFARKLAKATIFEDSLPGADGINRVKRPDFSIYALNLKALISEQSGEVLKAQSKIPLPLYREAVEYCNLLARSASMEELTKGMEQILEAHHRLVTKGTLRGTLEGEICVPALALLQLTNITSKLIKNSLPDKLKILLPDILLGLHQ